jgi:hypothetical protein
MSGCSYDTTCPNCRSNVSAYSDHKPYDYNSIGPCLQCGFYTYSKVIYLNLEDLNEARKEFNEQQELEGEDILLPLTELPEQDQTL